MKIHCLFSLVLVGCAGDDSNGPPSSPPKTDGGSLADTNVIPFMPDGAPDPDNTWVNATSNLGGVPSECGNLQWVSAKPDEDMLLAGVSLKGMYASTDGGNSWHPIGMGSGSSPITNRITTIVYDPQNPKQFWESGIYNGGGVYRTSDDGTTFSALGTVHHNDLVSIDFTDPARNTLVAGGHEQAQTVYLSTDGGKNWSGIGMSLPDKAVCTTPYVVDSKTYLIGCNGYGGGPVGIYRTTTSGQSWSMVSSNGGLEAPLHAADGSVYWAGNGGLVRSTDNGVNWSAPAGGNMIRSVTPIQLPDGRLATLSNQYVVVSADLGATWKNVTAQLPYSDAVGLAYSTQRKEFYTWRFDCTFNGSDPVPANAIMRHKFDTSQK